MELELPPHYQRNEDMSFKDLTARAAAAMKATPAEPSKSATDPEEPKASKLETAPKSKGS
jgi:hypothetical protein